MKIRFQILRVQSASRKHGNRLIDLSGRIFGHLKAVRVDEIKSSRISKKHMANAYFLCLCDLCGCLESVRSSYLRNGSKRMCSYCASAARVRYFEYVTGLRKAIWNIPDEEPVKKRSKRLKINKVAPGTYAFVLIEFSFKGPNAVKQIRPLRDAGASIREISELLSMSMDKVREHLVNHQSSE